jgi:hypothetical protein
MTGKFQLQLVNKNGYNFVVSEYFSTNLPRMMFDHVIVINKSKYTYIITDKGELLNIKLLTFSRSY